MFSRLGLYRCFKNFLQLGAVEGIDVERCGCLRANMKTETIALKDISTHVFQKSKASKHFLSFSRTIWGASAMKLFNPIPYPGIAKANAFKVQEP